MNRPRKIVPRHARRVPAWILAISVLAACGGGEGPDVSVDAGTDKPSSPDCNTTGAIEGGGRHRLSGLVSEVGADGELVVSDVRLSTAAAGFVVDGSGATLSAIGPGDVVSVTGTIDLEQRAGCAANVIADADVTGTIDTLDAAAGTLSVLGQAVRVVPDTVLAHGLDMAALEVGDRIRVSGLQSIGAIVASRIERVLPEGYFVSGVVTGVDASQARFLINEILVIYEGATLSGFPTGAPRDGDAVRVSGTTFQTSSGTTLIQPALVEYIDYGTQLVITPASASVGLQGSLQFLIAEGTGAVTWAVSSADGTMCSAATCGSIDASGRYVAPAVETAGPGVLITATSVADGGNRATATVQVTSDPSYVGIGYTVTGDVFSARADPIANAQVNIWVQQPRFGYSYIGASGFPETDAMGHFTAPFVPTSHIALFVSKSGYAQPCAATARVDGATTVRVELVPLETLRSFNPPRPELADEPWLTGQIYELTDAGRQPIADADVWLEGGVGVPLAKTRSDLGGGYFVCNFDDLPMPTDLVVVKDGYETARVWPVNTSESTTLDIELKRL